MIYSFYVTIEAKKFKIYILHFLNENEKNRQQTIVRSHMEREETVESITFFNYLQKSLLPT